MTEQDEGKSMVVAENGKISLEKINGMPEGFPEPAAANANKLIGFDNEGDYDVITPAEELPTVTGSDNGKLLGVSSGEWAVVDPPTELPAVTGSDNGDVLQVVEGAWAKATPSFVVPYVISLDEQTQEPVASTIVAYADIIEAIEDGKTIKIETSGLVKYHTSSFLILDDDSFAISITILVPVDTDVYDIASFQIVHTTNNVIHLWTN